MYKFLWSILFLALLWTSCSQDKKRINEQVMESGENTSDSPVNLPKVAFYQLEDSSQYPDAILELYSPLGNQIFRPGKVPFEFNIKNFPIENNTPGVPTLFTIINGSDPIGQLSPIFQRELTQGTYRVVGYLVDKEGISLKNFGNYIDRDFMVGDSRPFPYSAEPFLAVNFPRNGNVLAVGEDMIVDFLVLGGDMDLDGLKVKILVNDFEYEIDHMSPVRVENLPPGAYQVKIQLLRKDGKELEGPFSLVSKSVIVR
ncbi:hypothetical protein [Algoriphagus mannitolivorans]|uniref:hypothetical protein n=1 Tax=Algoriphagus mannitolivorans TaxID=226504 RepID=UPI0003FEC033|nr:hypothetical protein [Algoriphagus mannitolivorans]